jgi:outer membrane receptor protein involved in Fe transport
MLISKRFLFIVFLIWLGVNTSYAQHSISIKGLVVDQPTAKGLGLASIQVKDSRDSVLSGGLSKENGRFEVNLSVTGKITVHVEFLGYTPWSKSMQIGGKAQTVDLGTIELVVLEKSLNEIVVQAEKSSMQLSLDKKIFNVGKDLANAGGNAADILQNIPSVSVDPEGNVKLRGSDNVRIYIDGKPSGLVSIKGGSGLQQLQASLVERVELITNPSARYEAEGMAGIINIVLKKDRRQGFNGSFELITGNPANYGAAANLNYRKKNINFFINYGLAYRNQPGKSELYQETYSNDSVFINQQKDKVDFRGFNNNIRGGLDYFFSEKSVLTAAYLYRRSQGNRIRNFLYNDYLNSTRNLTGFVKRKQDEDEVEPNSEVSVNYKKTFAQKGHELIAEVKYIDYWENSDQLYTQNSFLPNGSEVFSKSLVQRSLNDEFERQWLFQLDYTKPLGKEGKFETGIRSSFRNMVNDFVVSERNSNGSFLPLPDLDNVFVYDENIHGVYGILGNKTGAISYQAGLRAEWTDVTTTLKETNEKNPRDYVNLFPSAHLTWSLPKEHGVQMSYSRRVRRPFYNDLTPYVTFSDNRNFFSGNPDLNPEFSNVFELGHIKSFEKGSFTSSVYYRSTTDRIDRIRKVDSKGNSITRTENLVSEKAFGLEFTGGFTPYKWWKMDFNFNFFRAEIDGSNILPDYRRSTYSWFARQTSRFSLKKNWDFQLRMNYEAPQKTVQGRRKGLYYADVSVSKDVLKERGTFNLNVLDVFYTRKVRNVFEGPNFYFDGYGQFRPRQINLTFAYRIKQSKSTKSVKIINTD